MYSPACKETVDTAFWQHLTVDDRRGRFLILKEDRRPLAFARSASWKWHVGSAMHDEPTPRDHVI